MAKDLPDIRTFLSNSIMKIALDGSGNKKVY
jgi:hypothetical protein